MHALCNEYILNTCSLQLVLKNSCSLQWVHINCMLTKTGTYKMHALCNENIENPCSLQWVHKNPCSLQWVHKNPCFLQWVHENACYMQWIHTCTCKMHATENVFLCRGATDGRRDGWNHAGYRHHAGPWGEPEVWR